jgi:hypothetical protein
MTDAKTADAVYAQIGKLREIAQSKNVDIPEVLSLSSSRSRA